MRTKPISHLQNSKKQNSADSEVRRTLIFYCQTLDQQKVKQLNFNHFLQISM